MEQKQRILRKRNQASELHGEVGEGPAAGYKGSSSVTPKWPWTPARPPSQRTSFAEMVWCRR